MFVVLHGLGMFVADMFKSPRRLEAENLFLRHQLNIALRRAPPRLHLHGSDRALLVWITRIWPNLLDLSQVLKPETILRWHRSGFKAFWRWKSRHRAGRPKIDRELRDLIRRMSKENPLWGVSRIHVELLMLGFEVAQSTVSKYLVRPAKPPSQTWRTFLRNHAEAIAAVAVVRGDAASDRRMVGPAGHRCAVTSSRPTVWRHCSHSVPGRAISSIRPDMIFGKDSDTELTRKARQHVQGLHEKVLSRTPAQRWGAPDDFAGIAVFLAAPASNFITGAAIAVDGGYSVQA